MSESDPPDETPGLSGAREQPPAGPGVPDQDALMVQAVARGDRAAFAALYRKHGAVVARVVRRMGIRREDVEDMVQIVFLGAFENARGFEARSSPRAWLMGIAVNQTRNYIRSRVRAATNLPQFRVISDNPGKTAEETLDRDQQMRLLDEAIGRLPEHQREALVLCEFGELTAREVSATLGVPAGTVWRRVHEARQALRKSLEESNQPASPGETKP